MKIFTESEEIIYKLRELYEKYGYRRFKMSKFEEYAFYMEYKNFLTTQNIISFNDLDGSLLALKPDITLSIAKNAHDGENARVYYNENVYRVSRSIHEYKEIPQVGVEYIGEVDMYAECEMVLLAAKSMETMGGRYALDLSHMGFVWALLDGYGLSDIAGREVLESLGKKDADGVYNTCKEAGVCEEGAKNISALAEINGAFPTAFEKASSLAVCEEAKNALCELSSIYSALLSAGKADFVNLDFSIVNDMNYYNGLVFQGYLADVPKSVLSGGRYDNLLTKMGKKSGACGFALYLDLIELYRENGENYDADIVILYGEGADIAALEKAADFYRENDFRVLVTKKGANVPKAKKVIEFDGTKEVLV